MRQQLIDPADGQRRQSLERVAHIRIGVVPVDPCRVQAAHDRRGSLAARKPPANNQFERLSAIGRIWFSTQLLSIGMRSSLSVE
jgi:hypothetical protein